MAWDTNWLDSIDGIPPVVTEDYAMSVLARKGNNKLGKTEGANIWGYDVNNIREIIVTRARFVRGRLQLLNHDPDVEPYLKRDQHFMRKFSERIDALLHWVKDYPRLTPYLLSLFLLWEIALIKGKYDFKQDPLNQTWSPISSTK